jgi:ABC-type glycerol-3-phosphate transport system permease component
VALVSPTVIVVIVMVVLPVLWALLLSFQRIRLLQIRRLDLLGGEYTFRNYDQLLSSSEFFETARTTLYYSVFGTLGAIALGLAAALLVRRSFPGRGLVRGVLLLPWVAPVVAITFIWTVLLSPQLGFVNAVGTGVFGWDAPIPFLSQEKGTITLFGLSIGVPTALLMVIVFESWKSFPFAFLFLLARLQAVPGELEEAAKGGRRDPDPDLPPHPAAAARRRDRPDRRAALHLHLQRVRRDLPAHGRRRGHGGARHAGVLVPDRAQRRRRVGRRRDVHGGGAGGAADGLPEVLRRPGSARMNARRSKWSRYAIEVRLLRLLRPLGIAFFVIITVFPFYYMVMLSMRDISAVIDSPGSLLRPLSDHLHGRLRARCSAPTDNGRGFVRFLHNSAVLAIATSARHARRVDPRRPTPSARIEFFGRRHKIGFLFLSVYLFPPSSWRSRCSWPSQAGPARPAARAGHRLRGQTLPVCVYMLRNYFETVPSR